MSHVLEKAVARIFNENLAAKAIIPGLRLN
jgi:hypothetical protein